VVALAVLACLLAFARACFAFVVPFLISFFACLQAFLVARLTALDTKRPICYGPKAVIRGEYGLYISLIRSFPIHILSKSWDFDHQPNNFGIIRADM
jgi:hypothetical protein